MAMCSASLHPDRHKAKEESKDVLPTRPELIQRYCLVSPFFK